MESYHSLNEALKQRFGKKVYKLALDAGMTCPNRDGTLGVGGCTFCGEKGGGDFAEGPGSSPEEQLERAKARVAAKAGDAGYIAYFQSFTNTYGPIRRLRAIYEPVAEREDLCGIAIATRPDCLGPEVMELLGELKAKKPLWVELGLQTIHERTAKAFHRGYALPVYDEAVAKLREAGIDTVTHVILGLPGESRQDMLDTVSYVAHSGVWGIKLQLLHVLRGTAMAADFEAGAFRTLTEEEYISLLEDAVRLLRPDMVVHRLTGDGAKRDLIAPQWSANKKQVLNAISAAFRRDGVRQGEHYVNY